MKVSEKPIHAKNTMAKLFESYTNAVRAYDIYYYNYRSSSRAIELIQHMSDRHVRSSTLTLESLPQTSLILTRFIHTIVCACQGTTDSRNDECGRLKLHQDLQLG